MSNDDVHISLDDLQLTTKRFYNRQEIKPWVRETLFRLKRLRVVVARLDSHKIIFRCKALPDKEFEDKSNSETNRRRRRLTTCPFKLRANYSIKNGHWNLLVISDSHDHPPSGSLETVNVSSNTAKRTAILSPIADQSFLRVDDDLFNASPENGPHLSISSTVPSNSTSVFSNFVDSVPSIQSDTASHQRDKDQPQYGTHTSSCYFELVPSKRRKEHLKQSKRTKAVGHSLSESSVSVVRGAHDLKSPDDVAFFLRQEINKLVQYNVVKNEYLSNETKTSLLDSITSQFILDHKSFLTSQFIEQLHQNYTKETKVEIRSDGTRKLIDEKVQQKHQHKQKIRKQNLQINRAPVTSQQQYRQRKSILNSWLSTPAAAAAAVAANGLVSSANTNLIPLSPLLNDSDNEYSGAGVNNGLSTNSIESLNAGYQSNGQGNNPLLGSNNSMIKNQILQVQNQSQQLPSFNSIQNQLPLSPGNNPSLTIFSNPTGASLMPPISNNSTTLNPSHLLIGTGSKNNLLNIGQVSSGNLFNDIKLGGTIPLTLNGGMNGTSGAYRPRNNNPTTSSTTNSNNLVNTSNDPTSQQLNQLNTSSFFSGMTSIGPNNSANNYPGNNTSGFNIKDGQSGTNSANLLNNMTNFTDPGW